MPKPEDMELVTFLRAWVLWAAHRYYEGHQTNISDSYFDSVVAELHQLGDDDPASPANMPAWGYKANNPTPPQQPLWEDYMTDDCPYPAADGGCQCPG